MTLIEMLTAVTIVVILASGGVASYTFAVDASNNAKAVADIATIGARVIAYQLSNDRWPATLAEIGWDDNDPWDHPYRYLSFAGGVDRSAARKDRNLVPVNSFFDLYSMGKDGASVPPFTAGVSQDDIVWANDGSFVGLAENY